MLCDECAVRPAGVTITLLSDGETHQRHLCGVCLERIRRSIDSGDAMEILMTLSPLMTESGDETPSITCGACGKTYEEFLREGVFGCPRCYEAFRERLAPLEKARAANGAEACDMPTSRADAAADAPLTAPSEPTPPDTIAQQPPRVTPLPPLTSYYQATAAAPRPAELRDMEKALAEAISLEQYERAAVIRDTLRKRRSADADARFGEEAPHV